MTEWISVDDRLPDTDRLGISEDVLIAVSIPDGEKPETILMVGFYSFRTLSGIYEENGVYKHDGYWEWVYENGPSAGGTAIWDVDPEYSVTHWMPLPQIPEGITDELCCQHDKYSLFDKEDE